MPQDENLQNLRILLAAMSKDHLGKADFTSSFKKLVDFVKKIKEYNLTELGTFKETLNNQFDELTNNNSTNSETLKSEINRLIAEKIASMDIAHKRKMSDVDFKMANVRDGRDADEKRVIKKTLKELVKEIPSIKKILKGVKKEKIRDTLEKLEGEERFDLGSIKGLRSILGKIDRRLKKVSGGGLNVASWSIRTIDNEVLGTGDGSTVAFTLSHLPSPATSLHIKVGTAEMYLTDDFTLSGTTVTMLIAPPNGAKVRADFRIG